VSRINIKTPEEIQSMQKCGRILGEILEQLASLAVPGATTLDLERAAERLFEQYNVIPAFKGYHGYPAILCTSVNNEVVHTIPSANKVLREGDILSMDAGAVLNGMITDSAIAIVIGGKTEPEIQAFVDNCIEALWKGIGQVKPGNTFGDISHAIGKHVEGAGYGIVEELTGHGVGHKLHEPPHIPNKGRAGKGDTLKPGMTFALEPITVMRSPRIRTLEDGWNIVTVDGSLGCQHEHTILVTEDGYEVLTLRPNEVRPA
jgi:methionyl aminopeptidase